MRSTSTTISFPKYSAGAGLPPAPECCGKDEVHSQPEETHFRAEEPGVLDAERADLGSKTEK
jgi:hypothetical protein